MKDLILKNCKLVKFLPKHEKEVFYIFEEFCVKNKLKFLKFARNQSSLKNRRGLIKKVFEESALSGTEKYILFDIERNKIAAFYCFNPSSNTVDWIFMNTNYVFTEKIMNSAKDFFEIIGKKYKTDIIYAKLLKRSKFEKYVKFVCNKYKAKIIKKTENYDYVEIKTKAIFCQNSNL
jgi:hypothetical protein